MAKIFRFLLAGAILPFQLSCMAKESYVCRQGESQKSRSHRISWGLKNISINHMDFSTRTDNTLDAKSPGGASNASITPEQIVANTIQDTAVFKLERPGGEIVPLDPEKLYNDIKTQGYATSYAATIPILTSYIFNRQNQTLEVRLRSLTPRMKTHPKRIWIMVPVQKESRYDPQTKRIHSRIVKRLSRAEAMRIFPPTTSRHSYPQCQEKYGFMGTLGHWIESLLFP